MAPPITSAISEQPSAPPPPPTTPAAPTTTTTGSPTTSVMITSQRDSEDPAFGDIDLDPIDIIGTSTTAAATAGIQMGLAGTSQKFPVRQIASQSSVTHQRLALCNSMFSY